MKLPRRRKTNKKADFRIQLNLLTGRCLGLKDNVHSEDLRSTEGIRGSKANCKHAVRRWQLFPVGLSSFGYCLVPKVANSVNHGLKVVYVPTKGDGEVRSVKVSKEISWFEASDHAWRPDV